jgi:hypothetical protein
MSFQLIARCGSLREIEDNLNPVCAGAEVFYIDRDHVGISVPTRLLDAVGEDAIRAALRHIPVYDLYAGVWNKD